MNLLGTFFSLSHTVFFGLAGLFGIGFVIGFHEFGHFLFCKLFKVRTPSFSIGFGPRLIQKRLWDTDFALSAIPLGGYVEIAGAQEVGQGEQKEAFNTDEHSFAVKPWYQKFLILVGGILFNLSFAYGVFSLLFMLGMPASMILYPTNTQPIIEMIRPGTPAEKAGLVMGDIVRALNGTPINNDAPALIKQLMALPNQEITLTIDRQGTTEDIKLTVEQREIMGKTVGSTGIIFKTVALPRHSFLVSLQEGFALTMTQISNSLASIKHIFSKGDTTMVAGPLRIIAETAKGAESGFKTFLLFLAFISIGLAVLNLLPLPILDGGQVLFYTIEAIIGRQIPARIREIIFIACWIGFLVFIIFVSYKDLEALIKPYWGKFFNT